MIDLLIIMLVGNVFKIFILLFRTTEACIVVLGIHDICHFTSIDIGYYPFYFQGYGILCSIVSLPSEILNIWGN